MSEEITFEYNEKTWPKGLIDITDRLVIREFSEEESDLCRDIYIKLNCMADKDPLELSPEEFLDYHRAYIRYQYGFYGYGNWGIFLRAPGCRSIDECVARSATMIGVVGLVNGSASQVGELSYALEACKAALEYGRECGFERFEARIAPDNLPSLNLAKKLGLHIFC